MQEDEECFFSIIFGKEFIVYRNKNCGLSRFTSLFKLFCLEDRMVLSHDEYKRNRITSSIIDAQKTLEKLRSDSLDWLENVLSK